MAMFFLDRAVQEWSGVRVAKNINIWNMIDTMKNKMNSIIFSTIYNIQEGCV